MAKTYQITLSEDQAEILVTALDMYNRIGMGQIGKAVTSHPDVLGRIMSSDHNLTVMDVQETLDMVVRPELFNFPAHSSYGIHSSKISDKNRMAYDIQQCIRHRLTWDRAGNPAERNWSSMMGVSFNEPHQTSNEPLPTIRKIEGSAEGHTESNA